MTSFKVTLQWTNGRPHAYRIPLAIDFQSLGACPFRDCDHWSNHQSVDTCHDIAGAQAKVVHVASNMRIRKVFWQLGNLYSIFLLLTITYQTNNLTH